MTTVVRCAGVGSFHEIQFEIEITRTGIDKARFRLISVKAGCVALAWFHDLICVQIVTVVRYRIIFTGSRKRLEPFLPIAAQITDPTPSSPAPRHSGGAGFQARPLLVGPSFFGARSSKAGFIPSRYDRGID